MSGRAKRNARNVRDRQARCREFLRAELRAAVDAAAADPLNASNPYAFVFGWLVAAAKFEADEDKSISERLSAR